MVSNGPCMFCKSGFILFDWIGEKQCAELNESNSSLNISMVLDLFVEWRSRRIDKYFKLS